MDAKMACFFVTFMLFFFFLNLACFVVFKLVQDSVTSNIFVTVNKKVKTHVFVHC